MPTRIVPPEGWATNPPNAGIQFGDGSRLRPDHNGFWVLSDAQFHQLSRLLAQGWTEWRPEKPKLVFKDAAEQQAIEHPLSIGEILTMCESEHIKVRVNGGVLQIKGTFGDESRQLQAHLQVRRIELRNFLVRLQEAPWKEV
jgi:hypothetical protein